ncbi:hypothetical protein BHE74_00045004 [Ensete ventricosum]|nr:hypothetical protein BHE74_00045004 [Ensete ventricosum]RZS04548.1 hypothetical protein BHM03_00034937 [Ensete ventricosum]
MSVSITEFISEVKPGPSNNGRPAASRPKGELAGLAAVGDGESFERPHRLTELGMLDGFPWSPVCDTFGAHRQTHPLELDRFKIRPLYARSDSGVLGRVLMCQVDYRRDVFLCGVTGDWADPLSALLVSSGSLPRGPLKRGMGKDVTCLGLLTSGFVPIVRSGGISLEHSEASTSGASAGAPSLMDTKALRDLEVMKACHDFDSTVIEGLLAVIRSTIASRRSLRCMLYCTGIDLTTRVLLV